MNHTWRIYNDSQAMHIDVNSFILNKVNKVHTGENAKMRYSDHGILLRLIHSISLAETTISDYIRHCLHLTLE